MICAWSFSRAVSALQFFVWIFCWSWILTRFARRHPPHHLSPTRANDPAGLGPKSAPQRLPVLTAMFGLERNARSGTVHEGKTLLYRASKLDCDLCPLKPQCCPKEPSRKIPRDIHEHARDVARSFAGTKGFETSRRERKKIEMRFAHLKRILKLGRLRLRGPRGAQDEFVLAAIAQNLRRLASLVARPPPAQDLCIA